MRHSDQIKAVRSYIVVKHRDGLKLEGSHWAPGYTAAHKETKEAALGYAIAQAEEKMIIAQAAVIELHDFAVSVMAGVED